MPIFEAIGEILVQMIIEPILYIVLSIPGAFVRYLTSRLWGSKKTFGQFLKEDAMLNGIVGLVFLTIMGIAIVNT